MSATRRVDLINQSSLRVDFDARTGRIVLEDEDLSLQSGQPAIVAIDTAVWPAVVEVVNRAIAEHVAQSRTAPES